MWHQVSQHLVSIVPRTFRSGCPIRPLFGGATTAWLARTCRRGAFSPAGIDVPFNLRSDACQCRVRPPLTCRKLAGSRLLGVQNAAHHVQVRHLISGCFRRSQRCWRSSGQQTLSMGPGCVLRILTPWHGSSGWTSLASRSASATLDRWSDGSPWTCAASFAPCEGLAVGRYSAVGRRTATNGVPESRAVRTRCTTPAVCTAGADAASAWAP